MYVRNFINVLFVTVLTWKLPQDPWTTMEKLNLPTQETLGMPQQLREIKQISFTNVLCREKPQCNLLTFVMAMEGRTEAPVGFRQPRVLGLAPWKAHPETVS